MKKEYYTYILLDPRKPGVYSFGNLSFDFEPFYVGKGSGRRLVKHLTISKSETKSYFRRKINKIFRAGLTPIGVKKDVYDCEKSALNREMELIAMIGRICEKTGPLTNLSSGGESPVMSEETRRKISESNKGKHDDRRLLVHNNKSKVKISINNAKYWAGKAVPIEKILKTKQTKKDRTYTTNKCTYFVVSPEGKEYSVDYTLERFCKEHNLSRPKMVSLSSGKMKSYKGWQCTKIKDDKSRRDKTYLLYNIVTWETTVTDNIIGFCKDRSLNSRRIYEVARGQHYCHKQWVCKEISSEYCKPA